MRNTCVSLPVEFVSELSQVHSLKDLLRISRDWVSHLLEADAVTLELTPAPLSALQNLNQNSLSTLDIWKRDFNDEANATIIIPRLQTLCIFPPALRELHRRGCESALVIPLVVDGVRLGTLCVGQFQPDRFSRADRISASALSQIISGYIKVYQRIELMQKKAETDELTSLHNRRAFRSSLDAMVARYHTKGTSFSLVLFDLDHFKQINDTHGHIGGDRILRAVSDAVRRNLHEIHHFSRIGGEEFAILLDGFTESGATAMAERFRRSIRSAICLHHGKEIRCTASFGVATVAQVDTCSDQILRRADSALYRAKNKGRDRVEVATAEDAQDLSFGTSDTLPFSSVRPGG